MFGSLRGWVSYSFFSFLFFFYSFRPFLSSEQLCTDDVFFAVDVAKNMDKAYADIEKELEEKLNMFGWKRKTGGVDIGLQNIERERRLPGVPMMQLRRASQTKRQLHKEESVY